MSLLIAPLEALTDRRLSDPERRVLLALYSFRNKNSDTVWPSLPSLAYRAHINDHPRVSKITKSLAEKGWLTKRKRGFTGTNTYSLSVPNEATDEFQNANLAPDTKLAPDDNANLAPDTKFEFGTRYQVQGRTKEQEQIEHQIKDNRASKSATPDGFDAFWNAYPRKKNRAAAIKAFKRITTGMLPTLFADIEARIRVGDWRLDQPEFIPHPATYLNGERWTDVITPRGKTDETSRHIDRPRSPGERFAALRAAQQAEARGNGQTLDGDAEHFRPPIREQLRAPAVGRLGDNSSRDHPEDDRNRHRADEDD